jgi:hypothetical protein
LKLLMEKFGINLTILKVLAFLLNCLWHKLNYLLGIKEIYFAKFKI